MILPKILSAFDLAENLSVSRDSRVAGRHNLR